jgi:hypothetical protein
VPEHDGAHEYRDQHERGEEGEGKKFYRGPEKLAASA